MGLHPLPGVEERLWEGYILPPHRLRGGCKLGQRLHRELRVGPDRAHEAAGAASPHRERRRRFDGRAHAQQSHGLGAGSAELGSEHCHVRGRAVRWHHRVLLAGRRFRLYRLSGPGRGHQRQSHSLQLAGLHWHERCQRPTQARQRGDLPVGPRTHRQAAGLSGRLHHRRVRRPARAAKVRVRGCQYPDRPEGARSGRGDQHRSARGGDGAPGEEAEERLRARWSREGLSGRHCV
mmetsp:Transcript_57942/g.155181  ORF Transcript_57942/g.155181 Transcript_57942/m.155181 type:complete len:235 (+) Transcript_57942:401-1105(+)